MMMSSGSSRPPRCSTVSSVIRPAGSITQTARGFSSSAFTISASDCTAVAPSFASASRGLALASNTTQWCPAFIRRREMLPPMRPSPITPICICFTPYRKTRYSSAASIARASSGQSRIDILEVDPQRATATLHQHLEVAAGLRGLDHAEAVGMAGHVDIGRIVAGDLQEHAGIRPAFVGLPGRMLEARSEAEAGRGTRLVANARAHRGQRLRVRLVALDVGQQRDVIARLCAGVHAAEMALQITGQRVVPAELGGVARIGIESQPILAEHRRLASGRRCDFS